MSKAERITLRLPVSLHARLVALAEKEGVSLNQYIVLNLSNCLQCYSIEPHTGRDRAEKETLPAPEPAPAGCEEWWHLKQYGYAPGGYFIRCADCEEKAWNCDKRAAVCRPCAEKRHSAANRGVL
jgi:hypothetical protein